MLLIGDVCAVSICSSARPLGLRAPMLPPACIGSCARGDHSCAAGTRVGLQNQSSASRSHPDGPAGCAIVQTGMVGIVPHARCVTSTMGWSPEARPCWRMPRGRSQIYCLAIALPKFELVGTSAWFFFLINAFKVPSSLALGLIHAETLALNAAQSGDSLGDLRGPMADHSNSPAAVRRPAAGGICRRGGAALDGVLRCRGRIARQVASLACVLIVAAARLPAQRLELKWAGDPEGGAPFVEADPRIPTR